MDGDLADVLSQGLKMEVLSWKLMTEEPQGCNLISQALNTNNEIAMATCETTALATVSETITFFLKNKALTERAQKKLAFEDIRKSVAVELRAFANQEAFVEMFDYVMSLGANNGPWIPALVAFLSVWVNSEKISLNAFKEVNKISNDFPRTKLSIIQRAT